MRFSIPLFSACLAGLPAVAQAQDYVAEAPVAVAFIAARTGTDEVIEREDGTTEVKATRSLVRIGMRDLLDQLGAQEIIPNPWGWRIVAVWADWQGTGSGYRFFVRRGSEVRAIPDDVLHFEVLESATARNLKLDGDTIVGGSEAYTSYAQLKVSLYGGVGTVNGLATSSDTYRRPFPWAEAIYLPGFTSFKGIGVWEDIDPEVPDAVLEGRFLVGAMRPVSASPYQDALSATASGTVTLTGVTKSSALGSSALNVAASTVSGAITVAGGTLTLTGGTVASAAQVDSSLNVVSGTLASSSLESSVSFSPLTLSEGTTLTSSQAASPLIQTVTIPLGASLQQSGATVVTGASLSFANGTLNTVDLSALPPGYVIIDGVLTTVP